MPRALVYAAVIFGLLSATASVGVAAQQAEPAPAASPPGKALVEKVCVGCHELDVVTSTGRTPEGWSTIIDKMLDRGLDAPDADLDKIKDYLVAAYPAAKPKT